METKNWIRRILIISLSLFLLSSNMFAYSSHWRHRRHRHPRCRECKPISAPLDGGLVTVLSAAGIAYFIIRKKKK